MDTDIEVQLLKDSIACLRKTYKVLKATRSDIESQQRSHMQKAVDSDKLLKEAQSLQKFGEAMEHKANKTAHMEIAKSLTPRLKKLETHLQELDKAKADFERKLDSAIAAIERRKQTQNLGYATKKVEERAGYAVLNSIEDLEKQLLTPQRSDLPVDDELEDLKKRLDCL